MISSEGGIGDIGKSSHLEFFFSYTCTVFIYLKMFIYMYACMWNVVMCMLSKINYKKENIQLMLSFGLKTNTI